MRISYDLSFKDVDSEEVTGAVKHDTTMRESRIIIN